MEGELQTTHSLALELHHETLHPPLPPARRCAADRPFRAAARRGPAAVSIPFRGLSAAFDMEVQRPAEPVRERLSCAVCKDILRGAYTAPECMHTFCRACIEPLVLAAEDEDQPAPCPVCKRSLGMKPFATGELRFDRTLTALVQRLFPRAGDAERMSAEETRAQKLREDTRLLHEAKEAAKPRPRPAVPAPAALVAPTESERVVPSAELAQVAFELRQRSGLGAPIARPFLRTSPGIRADQLAAFVPPGAGRVQFHLPDGTLAPPSTPLENLLQKGGEGLPYVSFDYYEQATGGG
jgi:Zinc finger, C3HC4 type (RING finger)